MMNISGLAIVIPLLCLVVLGLESPYVQCPFKSEPETRKLFIATCDTRSGWKEFQYMKLWNVTGEALRSDGIHMKNVCKGENWGKHGFLTKPLIYLEYIKSLMSQPSSDQYHILLMDSDTFWSAQSAKVVWNKYDCAREGKHVVISTEMSCWVGRYCQKADLDRWYSSLEQVPSYSPFVNSGVVMGKLDGVAKMLDYVIKNNQSYFTTYVKHKFDDQYAIADYGINVAPKEVALDYRQQISASASIHAPGTYFYMFFVVVIFITDDVIRTWESRVFLIVSCLSNYDIISIYYNGIVHLF